MNRLLLAGVGLVAAAGLAWAGPPTVAGKERTNLEQEFYLAGQQTPIAWPAADRGRPDTTAPSGSFAIDFRAWVVRAMIGPLSVSPLVPAEMW